jgi:hypothetical protein
MGRSRVDHPADEGEDPVLGAEATHPDPGTYRLKPAFQPSLSLSERRDTDPSRTMTTTDSRRSTDRSTGGLRRFVGVPFRLQTYRNLLYLVLAFPLGLAYFVGLVTGTALGVGLLITWVGLPILLLTLAGAAAAAGVEAALARRLVGVDASVPSFLREVDPRGDLSLPGDGFVAAVQRLVTAPSTWTSVVLLLAKFAFGLLAFVAVVTSGAVVLAALAAPLVYGDPATTLGLVRPAEVGGYVVGPWTVTTLPEALVVALGGVVLLLVSLNLLNALARIHARYTAALLRAGERTD